MPYVIEGVNYLYMSGIGYAVWIKIFQEDGIVASPQIP
jgi:hypothetical protein